MDYDVSYLELNNQNINVLKRNTTLLISVFLYLAGGAAFVHTSNEAGKNIYSEKRRVATQTLDGKTPTKYVTVTGAGNHKGRNPSNAMTLAEAIGTVVPGDKVLVQKGYYDLTTGGRFNVDGTDANPIIWEGEISEIDLSITSSSSDGTKSTLFRANSPSNAPVKLSGAFNYFRKIVFLQDFHSNQLLSIDGNYVQLDSCSIKYPSNASSSTNHTVLVTGNNVTFKHSSFYNGSRTIIWVRKNSGEQADFFKMEYCTLTGASNHPPIQIMPATNSKDSTTIKRPVIRNCFFIDNSYAGIYSRYCEQFAFYNNIFLRSGSPYDIDIHTGWHYPTGTPADTCNSKGGIIAYNTIIENRRRNITYNKGSNEINFINNIFYSNYRISDGGFLFNHPAGWNAIYRHNHDYNLYYYSTHLINLYNPVGLTGTWGSDNISVYYPNWFAATGQEQHTLVDIMPQFTSFSGNDFNPLNASSPQTGAGIPVTKANGFFMDITTDYFGNARDTEHPTIGAIEFVNDNLVQNSNTSLLLVHMAE